MVDFCASDGALLTLMTASIASATLLAPLPVAQLDAKIAALIARIATIFRHDWILDESRSAAYDGFLEDMARTGAGLKTLQRIVANGVVCRDSASH
jgi:hypothetical protein